MLWFSLVHATLALAADVPGADPYEAAWDAARAALQAGDTDEAIAGFEGLAATADRQPYGEAAIVQLVQMRYVALEARHGPVEERPTDALVEWTATSPWNTDPRPVYALSPEHQAFILADDRVLSMHFAKPTVPSVPDVSAFVETNFASLKYLPAQILYEHGHYDEARPRLIALLADDRAKCTAQTSQAARLLIDSFVAEGDLAQLRRWAKEFAFQPPGCPQYPADVDLRYLLESWTFKLALTLVSTATDDADHIDAAEAFLAFTREFPDSEYVDMALYNAANELDRAGQVEKSNALYQEYVDRYPRDPRSDALSFRIASNYETIFEIPKAIEYYRLLIRNFPDASVTPDAVYNAAFLSIGVGDPLGAARGFEDYARRYPARDDAVEVLWQAGEPYEAVGPAQAIAFYSAFRDKHGTTDPNYLLACDQRLAAQYARQGNTAKSTQYLDLLLKDWDALEAAGRIDEIKPEGRHDAALSALRGVQARFEVLTKDPELPTDFEKWDAFLAKKATTLRCSAPTGSPSARGSTTSTRRPTCSTCARWRRCTTSISGFR